jgi:site-specific DNA-methyltransferase (adenine-specific)
MLDILAGDNRASLAAMTECSIDAVVTDPPYSLTSITKRFGAPGSAPAKGGDGSFGRVSGGFMGKAWDATGIERDPEFWAAVYRVMKPGAFVFAFAGARTGHWQACAMEQAGFIMHPMHAWLYGQGFPKGHAVDDAAGEQWDGWKYGTQTQKPAMEPIYLGQKPYDGKPVESILKWGVGAFNIDGCRVPGEAWKAHRATGLAATKFFTEGEAKEIDKAPHELGRYPANVLHDGSAEVVALFPDSAARFFNSFPPEVAFYHAKAGKQDRAGSKHPTVKPIGLLRHLIRHICPPGGTVLDPFAGSGTTAAAAQAEGMHCVLMEADLEYLAFLRQRFVSEIAEDIFA